MRRGTTPVVLMSVDRDMNDCDYYVTFRCCDAEVTKSREESYLSEDGRDVAVTLEQAETLLFKAGHLVSVQLKYKDGDGYVGASSVARATVEDILLEEVI